eukprot:Opistho-2@22901
MPNAKGKCAPRCPLPPTPAHTFAAAAVDSRPTHAHDTISLRPSPAYASLPRPPPQEKPKPQIAKYAASSSKIKADDRERCVRRRKSHFRRKRRSAETFNPTSAEFTFNGAPPSSKRPPRMPQSITQRSTDVQRGCTQNKQKTTQRSARHTHTHTQRLKKKLTADTTHQSRTSTHGYSTQTLTLTGGARRRQTRMQGQSPAHLGISATSPSDDCQSRQYQCRSRMRQKCSSLHSHRRMTHPLPRRSGLRPERESVRGRSRRAPGEGEGRDRQRRQSPSRDEGDALLPPFPPCCGMPQGHCGGPQT